MLLTSVADWVVRSATFSDFVGRHGKAASRFAGARGLNRSVERQQVGLSGSLLDRIDNTVNLLCGVSQAAQTGRLRPGRTSHQHKLVTGRLKRPADTPLWAEIGSGLRPAPIRADNGV
jgi:hypothetical protein